MKHLLRFLNGLRFFGKIALWIIGGLVLAKVLLYFFSTAVLLIAIVIAYVLWLAYMIGDQV